MDELYVFLAFWFDGIVEVFVAKNNFSKKEILQKP